MIYDYVQQSAQMVINLVLLPVITQSLFLVEVVMLELAAGRLLVLVIWIIVGKLTALLISELTSQF